MLTEHKEDGAFVAFHMSRTGLRPIMQKKIQT